MILTILIIITLILLVLYIRAWKIEKVNQEIRNEISYAIFKHTK